MARKKSFAILGANYFGLSVAQALEEKKQIIKIFDYNEENLNKHINEFDSVEGVILDTTNKAALEKNGIVQFDGVIVCFGSNMESSILTVLNLIDLEVENIIVRARDEKHRRILKALGLEGDMVVIPDVMSAKMVATKTLFDIESEVQSTDGEFVFTNIDVRNKEIINKKVFDVGLNPNKDFNIVQIKRNGKIVIPDEYTALKENDTIVIFARNNVVNDLVMKIRGDED
ncbi:potassium channel family protein [Spiroplasma turonicum]|uniref:Potassium uptake protein KtrA n=1 Tax=Spiroplasma turonicum TaxID=216946 RepID=A0A0K1P4Y1_9MOLU|nr:TrkA family potassium uptake protein [Spiroplasma turonicum]AKU79360.1 potassium uptake protein KtrA [Spiroplasma turonicum]ALX70381.1 potassium uptake protein KtrA [Spiroplasma turonicum]